MKSPAYTKPGPGDEFRPARFQFDAAVAYLESEEAAQLTHSALEERLEEEGRELVRKLLQAHLNLRAVREERLPGVMGGDGRLRTQVRESARSLVTVLGVVQVPRLQYVQAGRSSLFPGDLALNLPEEAYSHGLRRVAAIEAAKVSYRETVASIHAYTAGKVPPRQVQELVLRAAVDFDAFYARRVAGSPEETKDPLILSLDGKGIVMRTEHLLEATRKKAEASQPKLDHRVSSGEKKNRKRMATVAAVYSIEPFVRTAAEVMLELRPVRNAAKKPRPRARNKRVWASVEKSAKAVTRELFDEAERRDPEHQRPWICLIDGDKHQIDRVRKEARRRGVEVVLVLDLIHALEYLWKAAWCFFEKGDRAAEKWVTERAIRILEGCSSDVAAGIRRSATKRGLKAKDRKGVDTCADYLLKKKKLLRYDIFLATGSPIATGVIEGACRHLINDRLDVTGARWSVPGAEAVLRLRSMRSSGDFEEYWDFHLRRERQRNHLSRYPQKAQCEAA
jgi:hypothetical protein